MTDQINDKPTLEQVKKRFSEVTGLTLEEVEKEIGAATEEEVLQNIQEYTRKQIQARMPAMNRAQRRALAKKQGKKTLSKTATDVIAETTKKINYIDLIQKIQALNKKREEEEGEIYENENEGN